MLRKIRKTSTLRLSMFSKGKILTLDGCSNDFSNAFCAGNKQFFNNVILCIIISFFPLFSRVWEWQISGTQSHGLQYWIRSMSRPRTNCSRKRARNHALRQFGTALPRFQVSLFWITHPTRWMGALSKREFQKYSSQIYWKMKMIY